MNPIIGIINREETLKSGNKILIPKQCVIDYLNENSEG